MLEQALQAFACGSIVGFMLALVGGGGTILATPLLLYVVGLPPHTAIGTGAFSVAVNALANLYGHARSGNVRWVPGCGFAVVGLFGALVGSTVGKGLDGQRLLFLFASLMIVVGIVMLRGVHRIPPKPGPAKLVGAGFATGLLSGFFGIGGGFLIVPALLFATGMPMLFAVGSSLVSVSVFGAATAVNYALSGFVDWPTAGLFVLGGAVAGRGGMWAARHLSAGRGTLQRILTGLIFVVAVHMMIRSAAALGLV